MRRRGFTLIEIFVVIGIIGVVSAIVFPAFAQARKSAQRTACQSNLRQIGLALRQYVQDYDGHYPLAVAGGGGSGYWWSDALRPYLKDRRVLWRPSVTRRHADYPNWDSSYIYNIKRLPLNGIWQRGNHEAWFANLSNILMVYDSDGPYDGSPSASVRWIEVPNCRSTDAVSGERVTTVAYETLHLGGSNFLFGDGHVKWLTPEAAARVECSEGP